jgi:hypothetical protein
MLFECDHRFYCALVVCQDARAARSQHACAVCVCVHACKQKSEAENRMNVGDAGNRLQRSKPRHGCLIYPCATTSIPTHSAQAGTRTHRCDRQWLQHPPLTEPRTARTAKARHHHKTQRTQHGQQIPQSISLSQHQDTKHPRPRHDRCWVPCVLWCLGGGTTARQHDAHKRCAHASEAVSSSSAAASAPNCTWNTSSRTCRRCGTRRPSTSPSSSSSSPLSAVSSCRAMSSSTCRAKLPDTCRPRCTWSASAFAATSERAHMIRACELACHQTAKRHFTNTHEPARTHSRASKQGLWQLFLTQSRLSFFDLIRQALLHLVRKMCSA